MPQNLTVKNTIKKTMLKIFHQNHREVGSTSSTASIIINLINNFYWVLDTVLRALHILAHLILMIALYQRNYYSPLTHDKYRA